MVSQMTKELPQFLKTLGLHEEPMGIFYTDQKPPEGFSPQPNELPTRAKEIKNEINWQEVFSQFSYEMFVDMIERFGRSFLTTKSWATVQKKIARSKKTWGEL